MSIPVTVLYGALYVLTTYFLAVYVSLYRLRHRVMLGEPVPDDLQRSIRAHGNSAEWLAVVVLSLFFVEIQGGSSRALHVFGGGLVAARVLHAAFMLTRSRLTTISATLTYLLVGPLCLWSLYVRLQ